MRVCVVGAGAIGGMLAVKLAGSGHDVSVVARGLHLKAIQENGLKLLMGSEEFLANNLVATDDIYDLSEQDIVLLALKGHQIISVLDKLPKLFGKNTVLVTLQNGIPWWYFQKWKGDYENYVVQMVDPDGKLANSIAPDRILGCIAYPASVVSEPGVIMHIEGLRFPVGEINNQETERVKMVSKAFIEAGFKSPVLSDIRSEIWLKLWGNLSFNPISALSHATLEAICQFPLSRELAETMMNEAQIVAEKLGVSFRVSLEKRIEGAEKVGKHKTSMLQDVEAGKPLEINAMLGAVIELAVLTNTQVPALRAMYACVCLLNTTMDQAGIFIQGQPR